MVCLFWKLYYILFPLRSECKSDILLFYARRNGIPVKTIKLKK